MFNYVLILYSAGFCSQASGQIVSCMRKTVEGSALFICNKFNVKDLVDEIVISRTKEEVCHL